MVNDMTEGSPFKILLTFSFPMLLSVIFQQLYNIIDTIIAGRYIGTNALAAVGASFPVTTIFMAFATGTNIGCSVIVSHLFGAKKTNDMLTAISTSFIIFVALSCILTVFGLITCHPILLALKTTDAIIADSATYLNVYVIGLIFLFMYNGCTAIFTALGDSKTPLYFLMFSSVLNIILDLLFVTTFNMGVFGVAFATLIAQCISSILSFLYLMKKLKIFKPTGRIKKFDFGMFRNICLIAIPSILQQSSVAIGQLLLQRLVNSYGEIIIAGYSAGIKLITFATTTIMALGNGISSFTAQNMGSGKPERVVKGIVESLKIGTVICILFTGGYIVFGRSILELFVNNEDASEVVAMALNYLYKVAPFFIIVNVKVISDSVLRAAGAMTPFMIGTFVDLFLRVLFCYIFAAIFSIETCWWAWGIGWTIGAAISMGYFLSGKWKQKHAVSV